MLSKQQHRVALSALFASALWTTSAADPPVCESNGDGWANCVGEATKDKDGGAPMKPPEASSSSSSSSSSCSLYLAKSSHNQESLGLFSGTFIPGPDHPLEFSDLHVPMIDVNRNEYSAWQEVVWKDDIQDDLPFEGFFRIETFTMGVGTLMRCADDGSVGNVYMNRTETVDSAGAHRSVDPSAGSFTRRHSYVVVTRRPISKGEELVMDCRQMHFFHDSDYHTALRQRVKGRLPTWLNDYSACIDNVAIAKSTVPKAGRGGFTRRAVKEGDVITTSPVLFADRSQVQIVDQTFDEDEGAVYFGDKIDNYKQLLLNYAFGHPNSTMLMVPYGVGVNAINHADPKMGQKPNAKIVWAKDRKGLPQNFGLFKHEPNRVMSEEVFTVGDLSIDYVATRDIAPGEEIFLDYGPMWAKAWEEHVASWKPIKDSNSYTSAAEYTAAMKKAGAAHLRTVEELKTRPYPTNIMLACKFNLDQFTEEEHDFLTEIDDDGEPTIAWDPLRRLCIRPCSILSRETLKDETSSEETTYYTVRAESQSNWYADEDCGMVNGEPMAIRKVPEKHVRLVDKEYSTDEYQKNAFRHEIDLPDGLYPDLWMRDTRDPLGDFHLPELKPNQVEHIRWRKNDNVVTKHAYIMGLKPKVRETLLDYCNKMGITEKFRDLTYRSNALEPDEDNSYDLGGLDWFIQRPPDHWRSNMHWISPYNGETQEDFLMTLNEAGFDEVLRAIGERFNMDGVTAYHLSFIGVSHCNKGYIHHDIVNTGAKVFNVIIPLILANETNPELDLESDFEFADRENDEKKVGRLRYQYDVASLMGDDAEHGTSAADYREARQMRMAATVYVADINEGNVDAIMSDYTQHFPPAGRPDILLGMAGAHWRRDDPTKRLPERPGKGNDGDKPSRPTRQIVTSG